MPKDTKIRVLELLNEHLYPSKIAKSLKLSLPTISGHINRLEKKSYITLDSYSTSKAYHLTEQGLAFLLKNTNPAQPVAAPLTQTLRIHSLAIAFPLRTPLAPNQPAQLLQSKGLMESLSGLKNQQSAYTQDGLLTPSSLILYLPELELDIHSDPRLAIKPLLVLAMRKAEDYEVKLGVRLKRLARGSLGATIIMNHNANTENGIAKTVLDKLKKFEVKDEDGNVRLIVDASDGVPEFEAVNAQNAIEDITKAQDFYLALLQGRFDYRMEKEARAELMGIIQGQNQFFTKHNALIETIDKREQLAIERDKRFMEVLEHLSQGKAKKLGSLLNDSQRRLFE